jgi:8-oxo-dGTP pyrophosphatase MutT (NUDIX family)
VTERQFTATAYVIQHSKVLLIPHPKLKKWLPAGGHLEANETPAQAALREVYEETGLVVEIIKEEHLWIDRWNAKSLERPYMCLLENIPPHGCFGFHQHIDFIYVAKPIGGVLKDEARWFSLEEIYLLESDVEIFEETKLTIEQILNQFSHSS